MIHVDAQAEVDRGGRQPRIDRCAEHRTDVRQPLPAGRFRKHPEHLRLDVDRVHQTFGADAPREFKRVEAVAAAHVADGLAGPHVERIEHQPAVLLTLSAFADEPRGAGEVHRLRDLAAAMVRRSRRDWDRRVDCGVDRQRPPRRPVSGVAVGGHRREAEPGDERAAEDSGEHTP